MGSTNQSFVMVVWDDCIKLTSTLLSKNKNWPWVFEDWAGKKLVLPLSCLQKYYGGIF